MRWIFIVICFLLLAPAFSWADDLQVVVDRIDRMERDMQNMQMEVFRGDGSAPEGARKGGNLDSSALSRLDSRLSTLEKSMRDLTGKVEELNHGMANQQKFQDKALTDMELRLQGLEQKLQALNAPAQNPGELAINNAPADLTQPIVPPTQPAANSDPKVLYDQSIAQLQKADYVGAETAFRDFIKQNPDHALTGNAQYWLGESFYVRGDFKSAAVEFLKAYKQYPKGTKAPDSLLKLGLSLANLENKKEACASFGKLSKEFPNASDSIKARADGEAKKLKCSGAKQG